MLDYMLNEGLKRENWLLSGMMVTAAIIIFLLILHYVFGFFPGNESYLKLP